VLFLPVSFEWECASGCLPRGFWEGFQRLAFLDLDGTVDSSLCNQEWIAWIGESLPKLSELRLLGNNISKLPTSTFHGFPSLNTLVLENNRISTFSPHLFVWNRHLSEVTLPFHST
jgi:Leucine-rich repeat (LRR) protein